MTAMHRKSAFAAALAAAAGMFGAAPLAVRIPPRRVQLSRHARRWGKGKVRIGDHSSLRKLMRAARRGKIPEERMGIIQRAMKSAELRRRAYQNSHA